jgi:hypothetical protein
MAGMVVIVEDAVTGEERTILASRLRATGGLKEVQEALSAIQNSCRPTVR